RGLFLSLRIFVASAPHRRRSFLYSTVSMLLLHPARLASRPRLHFCRFAPKNRRRSPLPSTLSMLLLHPARLASRARLHLCRFAPKNRRRSPLHSTLSMLLLNPARHASRARRELVFSFECKREIRISNPRWTTAPSGAAEGSPGRSRVLRSRGPRQAAFGLLGWEAG